MNRNILIAAGGTLIVLAAIILAILGFRLFAPSEAPEEPSGESQNLFPTGTSVGDPTQLARTKTLTVSDGGSVAVKDFVSNGETVADVVNPGSYVLAGDLGYCLYDGTCPHAATSSEFSISYDDAAQSFLIVLLAEPIGASRLSAESFLRDRLGITDRDLCRLNYYVGVPFTVNTVYTGSNLGFSFCPGAAKLP